MEVYVPLAERIGLEKLKVEMQDLTFGVLHPEIKKSITDKLIGISTSMQDMIPGIKESLELLLKSYHVVAQVHGRVKAPYSAWVKTRDKQLPLEELLDIFGFRIITDTTANCYRVLSILHNHYTPVLECFQDYIMHPKQNGYQSLHTVVVTPSKQKIEVQIRTFHMHEIAEVGIAAHWTYKQGYRVN
jgi:GTP pyrophosphokinase